MIVISCFLQFRLPHNQTPPIRPFLYPTTSPSTTNSSIHLPTIHSSTRPLIHPIHPAAPPSQMLIIQLTHLLTYGSLVPSVLACQTSIVIHHYSFSTSEAERERQTDREKEKDRQTNRQRQRDIEGQKEKHREHRDTGRWKHSSRLLPASSGSCCLLP